MKICQKCNNPVAEKEKMNSCSICRKKLVFGAHTWTRVIIFVETVGK